MSGRRRTAWGQCLAVAWLVCALSAPAAASDPPGPAVPLTGLERLAGWRDLLADGLEGWLGTHATDGALGIGPGWSLSGGVLHLEGGGQGGDLVSRERFGDFELSFEWCVSAGANSGVKVRVPYDSPGDPRRGPEYQVLDDEAHPDGRRGATSAAALYDLVAPAGKPVAPPLRFRRGRIVARGDRLEHWLDGQRVVAASVGSPEFEAARAASKFAGLPDFAKTAGHVVLQDHGDEVWFRRVFLRDLSAPVGRPADLDLGPALEGWSTVGDAAYTGDGTTIVGEVTGGEQSFLHTDRLFGNFILEVDVKIDVLANSGIQVRSTIDPQTGALSGYQVEIDPSERRWSGGLYDERRRGWLDDLSEDAAARAAFDLAGWNRYRIECIGPSLRAWVNGVPTADHLDGMTLEGVIGLQVHNGPAGRFRWRDLSVRELGTHRWEPVGLAPREDGSRTDGGEAEGGSGSESLQTSWDASEPGDWAFPLVRDAADFSVRIRYAGDGRLRLRLPEREGAAHPGGPDAQAEEGPLHHGLGATGDGSRVLEPLMGTGPDSAEGRHVLEVHAYGDRLAVVQDGKTVADVRGAPVSRPGARSAPCVLEARVQSGQVLQVLGVERLVAVPAPR